MTDVVEQTTTDTTTEEKPKPAKLVKTAHPCACSTYFLTGETPDERYAPECELTTFSTFGQGHDARLVAFLVDGFFDGYQLGRTLNGTEVKYASPAEAVAGISEALRLKAEKATENRANRVALSQSKVAAREAKKAEAAAEKLAKAEAKAAAKEAAKAEKAKTPQAEVVAGSETGDQAELRDGQARIKVGRWKYVADVDAEGNATYTDGKGETVPRGGSVW